MTLEEAAIQGPWDVIDEFEDALDARPIRQGDVFQWVMPYCVSPWKFLSIVVTADCDIVGNKMGNVVSYVPCLTFDEYIWMFWREKRFSRQVELALDEVLSFINKQLKKAGLADISRVAAQDWLYRSPAQDVIDALRIDNQDLRERLSSLIGRYIDFRDLLSSSEPNINLMEGACSEGVQVREGERAIFVTTPNCSCGSKLLVIRRSRQGFFEGVLPDERRQVFDRCVRLGLRAFGNHVTLNPRWSPFHSGNRVSIFAYNVDLGNDRIVAEVGIASRQDCYVFDFIPAEKAYDLASLSDFQAIYAAVAAEFQAVCGLLHQPEVAAKVGQIELG